jgi:porin
LIGARPLEAAAAYAIGTLVSKGRDNVPMASPQLKARTARRVELCLQAIVLLALGVVIVICGTSAEAADLVGNGAYTDQAAVPWLLGDWDSARLRLRDVGVDFQFGYVGEAAGNATGGLRREVAYADQWAAGVTLDLGRLGVVEGSPVQVTYTDRNGRNLSDDADLGTFQEVEEIYGRGHTARLTRFWYNQKFADGLVEWKIGRMPFSEDFSAFPCDFQNLTFCGTPAGNIVGSTIYNWPISQWATRLKFNLEGWLLSVRHFRPEPEISGRAAGAVELTLV